MRVDKTLLQLTVFAFLILALTILFTLLGWDSTVYLLSAEHFLGKDVYFDNNAPRILSQIVATVWKLTGISETVARLISVLMSVGLLVATYLIANELFNKRVALFAFLFLLLNPLFLLYSSKVYTDISLALIITITTYLFYTGLVKDRPVNLMFSGVFIAIAVLIKYPGLILYFITASFILLKERKAIKNPYLWLSYLISLMLLIPSMSQFSGGVINYASTFPYLTEIQNPHYFITLPLILLTATPLFVLLLLKKRMKLFEGNYLILLLTIFFIFGFYQIVSSKDIRYLLPLFPSVFILASKGLDEMISKKLPETFEKIRINFKKIFIEIFLLPLIASFILLFFDFYYKPNSIIQAAQYLKPVEGSLIISNYWPEISFYSQKTTKWFPSTEEKLHQQMSEFKIDYVVAVETKKLPTELRILGIYTDSEPIWVQIKNIDSLSFLTKVKQLEDNLMITAVYKFNENIPNRTLVNVTDKLSLAELLPNN